MLDLTGGITEFTEAQISELKKNKVLLILDGVDEARHKGVRLAYTQHLYFTNKLFQWTDVKVIFGVRIEGSGEATIRPEQFQPYASDSPASKQMALLQETVICPFSETKTDQYLERYVAQAPIEWQQMYTDWVQGGGSKYLETIHQIRGAQELVQKPFTLRVLAEVLPGIVAAAEAEGFGSAIHLELTETRTYEEFVGRWFTREEAKIVASSIPTVMQEEGIIEYAWDYCMLLANEMLKDNISKVVYARRFGKSPVTAQKWDPYFGDDEVAMICKRIAPLKRSGRGEYAFLHAYLQDFFATRYAGIESERAMT